MKLQSICLLTTALIATVSAATELQVTVVDGPTECDESKRVSVGKAVSIHYTGFIDHSSETGDLGSKFDSSHDKEEQLHFQIGTGHVIKGWDEGLIGLCVGASAMLVVPPHMGYGGRGAGDVIPGNATLKYKVDILWVQDSPASQNYFAKIDSDEDGKISFEEFEAYFEAQGIDGIPEGAWEEEDKDGDGFISFDEFSGPKIDHASQDEL